MTTLVKIMEAAASATAIRRQYEVPSAVQQVLAWQREHVEALRWMRERQQALLWQNEIRQSAAAQLAMRLALDGEMLRASKQAADFRQMVAAAQPPAPMLSDQLGSATASHTVLDHHASSEWISSLQEMRKPFASIEELSRYTCLMRDELTRWAREEAKTARYLRQSIEPGFSKLIHREHALYRSADSLISQWTTAPDLINEYPAVFHGAPFVAPNSAARAILWIVEQCAEHAEDYQADRSRASDALALSREERDRRLGALHEAIAESLAGARQALAAGGPDFAAKCCVCLRRALETALDVVAPIKAVMQWKDPRMKIRDDRKGPTRASRLFFAFRNIPENHRAARFVEADVMMTEALMDTINPTIHRANRENDGAQLDIYVQRMEMVLLVLSSLQR